MLLKGPVKGSGQLTEALLAEYRPVLFRYALLQLRDDQLAEDVKQETLLAAWLSLVRTARYFCDLIYAALLGALAKKLEY